MRVLLAIDGSPSSGHALDLVAGLRWPAGSTIRLLTVVPIEIGWGATGAPNSDAERAATEILEHGQKILAPSQASVELSTSRGRPASMILREARLFGPDLIVVGSRGHGPIASMILGSVSTEVLDRSRCPVLVVRRPTVGRVIIGVDGSPSAARIPGILAGWEILYGREAIVTHVIPPATNVTEMPLPVGVLIESRDWRTDLAPRAERLTRTTVRRLREAGVAARADIRVGDPANELIKAAREWEADLIVTGSRGHSGLASVMLGSVARNVVLHAECSTLVLRRRTPASTAAPLTGARS